MAPSSSSMSKAIIYIPHPSLSSSLPPSIHFRRRQLSSFLALSTPYTGSSPHPFPSSSSTLLSSSSTVAHKCKLPKIFSVLEDEEQLASTASVEATDGEGDVEDGTKSRNLETLPELYVCNLPRSYGISELLDTFRPYGTVQSVEVSRDAETGISRGCGCVIMSTLSEAKAAIAALDGSVVGGREMRVKFSVDMNKKWAMNLGKPRRNLVFESPYRIYAGNLSWSVRPEQLRNHFSQCGNVVSARVVHDRKSGKNRAYGFLSFLSPEECEAAKALDGTGFLGRMLLVRIITTTKKTGD